MENTLGNNLYQCTSDLQQTAVSTSKGLISVATDPTHTGLVSYGGSTRALKPARGLISGNAGNTSQLASARHVNYVYMYV